ncbi:MAG: chemotaxis protein CheW [Pyrinomonadaceae bacterium]
MTDPLEFLVSDADAVAVDGDVIDREMRELLIAQRGGQALGLFAAETDGIIAWKDPSPLPGAFPAVLGLVCVRGRMYTVIDPRSLAGGDGPGHEAPAGFIVLLAGEEQLGLAVERITSITEIFVDEIEPTGDGDVRSLIHGRWCDPIETVTIIDPARIFAAACGEPETSERSK